MRKISYLIFIILFFCCGTAGIEGYVNQPITITANNSTNETVYPLFSSSATGSQSVQSDTGLNYNPSTGVLTSTTFSGSLSGNSSTATSWQSSRTITLSGDLSGSVSIDGSADVTLSATVSSDTVALGLSLIHI